MPNVSGFPEGSGWRGLGNSKKHFLPGKRRAGTLMVGTALSARWTNYTRGLSALSTLPALTR